MRSWLYLIALGAFGCSSPSLDMSLEVPQQMPANFDLSCVTSIYTVAVGEDDYDSFEGDFDEDCIDVTNLKDYSDVQRAMSGQFTLDIPDSGLAAIEVYGTRGACGDEQPHDAIFYGGVPVANNKIARIKLDSNLSCTARKPYTVRVVDMLQLAATKQCGAVAAGSVNAGNVRDFPYVDGTYRSLFEYGDSASSQWTNGTTRIDGYTSALPASTCTAVSYDGGNPLVGPGGTRCIDDTTPTLCGQPGEVELGMLPFDFAGQSRDPALAAEYGDPLFGVVYEASTAMMKTSVAGATVTLDDPSQGKVVYVEKGATQFRALPQTSTNADGFFMVYLKGRPTTITISSPVHRAQKYKVASPLFRPTTLIAALTR